MAQKGGKRGGARKGAGRKAGIKSPRGIAREVAREYLSERYRAALEPLVTAQLDVAKGAFVMLGRVGDKWVEVTDPDLMVKCLNSGESFYKIMAQPPDTRAIKDILDREFGRPAETMSVAHSGEVSMPIQVVFELHRSE